MELTSAHVFSLTITLLLFVAPGLYAARQVRSAEDFSLGNRSAGVVLVSGTIMGTIIGGAATLGTAQLAFCAGMSALTLAVLWPGRIRPRAAIWSLLAGLLLTPAAIID